MSGCSTMKVDVDYDTEYNFSNKTKYAVMHSDREGENTLVNDRVLNAIKTSLNKKGYKEVKQDHAELIFVFHVNVQQMSDIRTDYEMVGFGGYGYPRGFGGYGLGYGSTMVATPSTYRWKEGKLIIDALNPQTKKIVWRGTVSDELTQSSATPQEKREYINRVVQKVLHEFPGN